MSVTFISRGLSNKFPLWDANERLVLNVLW